MGEKIDTLYIDIIEATSGAAFLPKGEKLPWVRLAARKLDTLKLLLMILWESGSLLDKKYVALSTKVDTVGKMLGGWQGQILRQAQDKQNSPEAAERTREK